MWAKTRDTLLTVEPGTPAGYGRIIALRRQLIAPARAAASALPARRRMSDFNAGLVSFHARLPRSRDA
jgi:ribosomal protein RSM22 (predicted rRNA methylase)